MTGDGRIRVVDADPDHAAHAQRMAELLTDGFRVHWPDAWPTLEAARVEVGEAFAPGKICLVARDDGGGVLGWIGAQPQYDGAVWELHPMVVDAAHGGRGIGRALVDALEARVRERGGLTLWLGTDDEDGSTTLGGVDLFPGVLDRLRDVRGSGDHPLEFYRRMGFEVTGIMPDANGPGKPDIFLAKSLRPR